MPSGADPTLSAALHAALSRAEAAEEELRTLKANMVENDDALQQHFTEWQKLDVFLQSLRKMGDKALRKEFKAFADVSKGAFTDAMDPLRISKQGLATLLAAKNVILSERQVDELMQRIDTDGDGEIDWPEFRTLVRSSSDLEMMFKGLPVERVLAACFPRGPPNDPLGPFFRQQHSDVVAAVRKAGVVIVKMTMDIIETQEKAEENQAASGSGAKFGAELTGRSFEAFFEGVTGLTGEPHPDLDR
jgi:Ca2+-binding EF-hand superfamily protein